MWRSCIALVGIWIVGVNLGFAAVGSGSLKDNPKESINATSDRVSIGRLYPQRCKVPLIVTSSPAPLMASVSKEGATSKGALADSGAS